MARGKKQRHGSATVTRGCLSPAVFSLKLPRPELLRGRASDALRSRAPSSPALTGTGVGAGGRMQGERRQLMAAALETAAALGLQVGGSRCKSSGSPRLATGTNLAAPALPSWSAATVRPRRQRPAAGLRRPPASRARPVPAASARIRAKGRRRCCREAKRVQC